MTKKIKIATAHSDNFKKSEGHKAIEIDLQGGSPYFTYIWIDDVLYTLYKTTKSIKIKKNI